MRLHDLKPAAGSHRDRKRLGRGNATGQGTTAGKGTKGQKARSGGLKAAFRGMSSRNARIAKRRGFTNSNKVIFQVVNLAELDALDGSQPVTAENLLAAGLIGSVKRPVKILAKGELTKAFTVQDIVTSAAARAKIEAAGGSVAAASTDGESDGSGSA